ncbi:MAG: hypothetical protein CSA21_07250 [Deltaproteobacteria bacterium]|nr:MAG: hypothetical protein CSA21_07250 [Deltaproteobacteria bacterium]
MKILLRISRFCASLRLMVILLLLLTLDLVAGWYALGGNASFFEPLNQLGLWHWLFTYGYDNMALAAWFFVLLLLLVCLVINTLFCTVERLYRLAGVFKNASGRRLWFRLSVHLMHLSLVLLLIGYFISYTAASICPGLVVGEQGKTPVPGAGITLALEAMEMIPYNGGRLPAYERRYIDASAVLRIESTGRSESRAIRINSPASFAGWSFFMRRFNPRSAGGMSAAKYIVVDARRDPGVIPAFWGMAAFMLGLLGYFITRPRLPQPKEK